jgi:hypothetical protein
MLGLIMTKPAKVQLWSEIEEYWLETKEFYDIKDNRQRSNVMARNAFVVALRKITESKYSYAMIGALVDRDHSTVLYAESVHDGNLKYDGNYRERYGEFYRHIYALNKAYSGELLDVTKILEKEELTRKVEELAAEVRGLMKENALLKLSYEEVESRDSSEREFLKQQYKLLKDRNDILNKELIRLKNLL